MEAQTARIGKLSEDLRREEFLYSCLGDQLSATRLEVSHLQAELSAAKSRISDLESENFQLKHAHLKPLLAPRNRGVLEQTKIPKKNKST